MINDDYCPRSAAHRFLAIVTRANHRRSANGEAQRAVGNWATCYLPVPYKIFVYILLPGNWATNKIYILKLDTGDWPINV